MTLGGWCLGLMAESCLDSRALRPDLFVALLFSPLTAAIYGDTLLEGSPLGGTVLGLLFWPVWVAFVVSWVRTPSPVKLVLLALWCGLGFFRPMLRLDLLMSV